MIRLKTAEQIEGIRRSCRLLSSLFAELKPLVKVGATTGSIDAFAKSFIEKGGGRPAFLGYEGYPGSICISVNEEVIHGIPGKRVLKDGDIVSLDCGIDLEGYISDAAITLPVGSISEELERLLKVTRECLELGIGKLKPGARVHDLSRAIFSHAHANGYGVVRQFCGHGVGFALHEDPQVPNYVSPGPNPRIAPGMVLALEPMINVGSGDVGILEDGWTVVTLDGKPSAHFEHTVAVLADGIEILTEW